MVRYLELLGKTAGVVGAISCLGAGLVRITGRYNFAEIPVGLVFELGVGLMVFACLLKLYGGKEN